MRQLTEKCWVWWEFRRASTAWGTKMVQDLIRIFLVALTQRVGHDWVTELNWTELTQKGSSFNVKEGIPLAQAPVAGCHTLWANGSPCVLGHVPQGIHIPLPFHMPKGKRKSDRWDAQGQVDSSYSPLRPWRFCLLVLSIKLDQDCYCLVKHTEIWP